MELVVMLLGSFGLCFGLMNDKVPLLHYLRRVGFFHQMLSCAYCTGFHTGWMTYFLLNGIPPMSEAPGVLIFALGSSAFCYLMDTLSLRLERG